MKNLLLIIIATFAAVTMTAQESLIAGIMQVDPVNITIGEADQKKVDEYDAKFAEETTKLDEELAKLGEAYAESVTKLIQKFSDSMTKGEERMIKNEKQRVETMSNSLTFNLIKDKKSAIQRFKNNLVANTRELPRAVAKMKEKEMEDVIDDYKEKVHAEFEANKRVIRAFKATEHVTKTQYTGEAMPVDNQ
jgi:hypothetical protein